MSNHIQLAHDSVFVCDNCHERYAMAMPCRVELFSAAATAFEKAHQDCQPGKPKQPPASAQEWAQGDDVGNSSLTIYSVLKGNPGRSFTPSVPLDPSDFGRCYRLLEVVPEWRSRLHRVSAVWPEWAPLVERWGEMERLYLEELPTGRCPKLYELMQKLTGREVAQ